MAKIVLIENGRLGNILFQLSLMHYFRGLIPEIEILLPEIPILKIEQSQGYADAINRAPDLTVSAHEINEDKVLWTATSNKNAIIHCSAWGMKEKYYGSSQSYIQSLIHNLDENPSKKKKDELVFHIRGGDIWKRRFYERKKQIHPDYRAIPISFYRKIQEMNDKPVKFVSESTVPKWYLDQIKSTSPGTNTIFSKSVLADFTEISQASEIGLGISTFSWMAAFVGAPSVIHMPILGIFDVDRRPDLNFCNPSWNIRKYGFEQHEWNGTDQDKEWLLESKCVRV